MEPDIVALPQFIVAGVPYFGKPEHGQFTAMWAVWNGIAAQFANAKDPPVYYGVETYTAEFQSQGKWFYLAGMEVLSLDVPIQAVIKIIPANTYAVFKHEGTIEKLAETFQKAYHQWLPGSGYIHASAYDLERYDERFLGPMDPNSVMDVLLPVKML